MHFNVCCFAVCFAFLALAASPTSAGIAELINDVEDPMMSPVHTPVMSNFLQDTFEENGVGTPCHVEYQVTKRAVGRCIKLGHGTRGCVSGTYLNPFHPECM